MIIINYEEGQLIFKPDGSQYLNGDYIEPKLINSKYYRFKHFPKNALEKAGYHITRTPYIHVATYLLFSPIAERLRFLNKCSRKPDSLTIDHIDNDRYNNDFTNLKAITMAENTRKTIRKPITKNRGKVYILLKGDRKKAIEFKNQALIMRYLGRIGRTGVEDGVDKDFIFQRIKPANYKIYNAPIIKKDLKKRLNDEDKGLLT